jgi:hypothetical protein
MNFISDTLCSKNEKPAHTNILYYKMVSELCALCLQKYLPGRDEVSPNDVSLNSLTGFLYQVPSIPDRCVPPQIITKVTRKNFSSPEANFLVPDWGI